MLDEGQQPRKSNSNTNIKYEENHQQQVRQANAVLEL